MKNLFPAILLVCLLLPSCKTMQTYYEICEIESKSLTSTDNGQFVYKDDNCSLSYNFWSDGGKVGFFLTNNSDEILYVDLAKSFFIKNGIANDYFLNRTISSSASIAESVSASKGATAFGYWRNFASSNPGAVSSSVSANSATVKSTTVETVERQLVAIPPHASKYFLEYFVSPVFFYDCEYKITPTKKEKPSYSFDSLNSPISFANYITYRLGSEMTEHAVQNDFYISKISFLHEAVATTEQKVGCPNEEKRRVVVVNGAAPNKFYIKYSHVISVYDKWDYEKDKKHK